MRKVDRAEFLPPGHRGRAGYDGPLPIGFGQTNSQPRAVAAMLDLLDVAPGTRVLDVGSGSGWTTALLAHLTGPSGSVIAVERVPQLAQMGRGNVAATGMHWARVEPSGDQLGYPQCAPYDRILVSANAAALPMSLCDQLVVDGLLVVPVRGTMLRVRRTANGLRTSEHGKYRFVPLITD